MGLSYQIHAPPLARPSRRGAEEQPGQSPSRTSFATRAVGNWASSNAVPRRTKMLLSRAELSMGAILVTYTSERERQLYERFCRDNLSHISRHEWGWKRGERKIRWAK